MLCSCQITGWMDDITGSQSCQYVAQRLCKLWIDWLQRGKALGCSDLSSSFANQLRQGLAGKTGSPFAFSDRAPNNSLLVQHLQSQATLSSDSGPSNAWKTCESDTASRKLTQPTFPRKIPLFCFSSYCRSIHFLITSLNPETNTFQARPDIKPRHVKVDPAPACRLPRLFTLIGKDWQHR